MKTISYPLHVHDVPILPKAAYGFEISGPGFVDNEMMVVPLITMLPLCNVDVL